MQSLHQHVEILCDTLLLFYEGKEALAVHLAPSESHLDVILATIRMYTEKKAGEISQSEFERVLGAFMSALTLEKASTVGAIKKFK